MTETTEPTTDDPGVQREDIRLRTSEDGPVLKIGATEIVLRTFLDLPSDDNPHGERVSLELEMDCDGDNGSWWNLHPENGELHPWITIQPEVRYSGDET